ncbi:MAG: RNA 2',3'-cyclic phosphodiesterase [Bermanella sp.]
MRLFIAFTLPADLIQQAMAYQPNADENIRLSSMANLHVTLHFLGDADPALVHTALQEIKMDSFEACLSGTGQFSLPGANKILWLGIEPCAALLKLHDAIAHLLTGEGIHLSKHQYQPHLTLARCQSGYSAQKINNFLDNNFKPCWFDVNQFSLFKSEVHDGKQVYTSLQSYMLA